MPPHGVLRDPADPRRVRRVRRDRCRLRPPHPGGDELGGSCAVRAAQRRREAAQAAGFSEVLDPGAPATGGSAPGGTSPAQVDAFIDASGAEPAVQAGMRTVRPGGRVVLVGMGADEMTLPVSTILTREIVLTGVFRYASTWPAAITLVASGAVDLDSLVTARFGLAEVERALETATRPEHRKVLVLPSDLLTV
ncbi:zinc-binding dehydrogenase [Brachybacterium epidermidis]|uniref:zinc-binding dehydrogenase n=1 Tax=Brachybacterium epidermidis TaxID=2781983 RepID=UPI00398F5957